MKKAKSLPKLRADLQKVFNEFIRLRDKDLPCISCNQFKPLQAGHYYSVKGYDGLRFDEFNTNGECAGCNCFDESHLIGYGENLLERLGVVNFGILKMRAVTYKRMGYKWSRTQLEEKIQHYKNQINELSRS